MIRLAYDGAPFHGWQMQKTAVSVQEVITTALRLRLKDEGLSLVGCGRTDTGVHARDFYAHFDLDKELNPSFLKDLAYRLNRQLPGEIVVYSVTRVPESFHARFSAVSRTYCYYIHNRKDPFLDHCSWPLWQELDLNKMFKAAALIKEYEDFTSFARLHSQTETNICHVSTSFWKKESHRITYTVTADRFLRNMVRALVGTMVDVGLGKTSIEQFRQIIESRDRSLAGKSAPAHGLFLEKVRYPVSFG